MRSNQTVNKDKKIITLKSLARELLFSDANYITLILAIIISVTAAVLPYMIVGLISEFIYSAVSTVLLIGLEFLIAAPMALGIIKVCCAIRDKRKDALGELFFAFASLDTYLKTLLLAFLQMLKVAVEIGLCVLALSVIDIFRLTSLIGITAKALVVVVVIFAVKLLTSRFYGYVYFALREDRVKPIKAVAESWKFCKKDGKKSVLLWLSFLPLLIISAIPLGLPLLLYTVPYMLCSYVYYMSDLESGRCFNESYILPEENLDNMPKENDEIEGSTEICAEIPDSVGNNEIIENGDISNE